jgi:type IV pilus assembly protein PilC
MADSDKSSADSSVKPILALLMAGGSLAGLILAGVFETSAWADVFVVLAVFFFAILVVICIRMIQQAKRGEGVSLPRAMRLALSPLVGVIVIVIGIVLIGFAAWEFWPAAAPVLIYGLVFGAIIMAAWSRAARLIRRRRMLMILGNVEKATQLNLPLSRMILAAAEGETGKSRARLIALHDHLDRGESLDDALISAVPEIPRHVARAVGAGHRLGCLPQVLESLIRRRRENEGAYYNIGMYWTYLCVFLGIFIGAVSLFMIVVIPKFQGIFHDFHAVLPPLTQFLLNVSRWFTQEYGWAYVLLGPIVAVLLVQLFRLSEGGKCLLDAVKLKLPLLGRLARDRGMADLCDLTALGIGTGHPLGEVLHEAAAAQPNLIMRRRTAAWADAITRGEPISPAARRAHLPHLFVAMLATTRDSAGLLQVLGFLWRHYEYRLIRAKAILESACVPVIVFLMGGLVAFLGLSMFQPITMLSQYLGGYAAGGGRF